MRHPPVVLEEDGLKGENFGHFGRDVGASRHGDVANNRYLLATWGRRSSALLEIESCVFDFYMPYVATCDMGMSRHGGVARKA